MNSASAVSTGEVPKKRLTHADRDLRLDFIRGIALLTIFVDHNQMMVPPGHFWLQTLTFGRFFWIDMADVFVFLSGYVSGMVYSRVLRTHGFAAARRRLLRRCRDLYVANLSLALICFTLIRLSPHPRLHPWISDTAFFQESLAGALWDAVLIRHLGGAFDLLPMFILFLAATPLVLHYLRIQPFVVLVLLLSVYGVAQFQTSASGSAGVQGWSLNPFAWQLVFFGGMILGYPGTAEKIRRWPDSRAIPGAAAAALLVIACHSILMGRSAARLLPASLMEALPRMVPFTGKHNAEPLRLFNLLLWITVIAAVPPALRHLTSGIAAPILTCGRYSLFLFSIGTSMSYLGAAWMGSSGTHMAEKLAFTAAGCGVLVGAAHLRGLASRSPDLEPPGDRRLKRPP